MLRGPSRARTRAVEGAGGLVLISQGVLREVEVVANPGEAEAVRPCLRWKV